MAHRALFGYDSAWPPNRASIGFRSVRAADYRRSWRYGWSEVGSTWASEKPCANAARMTDTVAQPRAQTQTVWGTAGNTMKARAPGLTPREPPPSFGSMWVLRMWCSPWQYFSVLLPGDTTQCSCASDVAAAVGAGVTPGAFRIRAAFGSWQSSCWCSLFRLRFLASCDRSVLSFTFWDPVYAIR